MTEILKLNSIADVIKTSLPNDKYSVTDKATAPLGVLVRSADMNSMEIPASVLAIARAGAGVNNIPLDACAEKGIVVFNTPGANANAVKELVIGTMITASRNAFAASDWAKTLIGQGDGVAKAAEKGKGQFVGPEIKGKTLGVVGLGAIGGLVANAAVALGMDVIGFDPFLSIDAAWNLSRGVQKAANLEQLIAQSDYITLHVPLLDSTKNMISAASIATMKDGVVILNFARGGLVNHADIMSAIASGKVRKYATDFISEDILDKPGIIALPHLGASTPESEDNCAFAAAKQLADYLERGIIHNSVNFPTCDLPYSGKVRITVAHKNKANMVGQITAAIASHEMNISDMINKSRGDYAYTIIDLDGEPKPELAEIISAVEGVIRVRIL